MKENWRAHWSYLITGQILASALILFWYFNQNYLTQEKNQIVLLLENPLLTFGLISFGAFISAFIFGEFSIKTPITYEPLIFSFIGGIIMGIGAVLAAMSVHSVVLFNLAGVFNLTAFMITKGWVYMAFMILGGFAGSKLLVFLTLKTGSLKKNFFIPKVLTTKRNQKIIFYLFISLFIFFMLLVVLFSKLGTFEKLTFVFTCMFLILFGLIVERGTICMSSMLKEWFISRSAYVWRSVLFTIMCLALLYQIGLKLSLYKGIELERYVNNLDLLIAGSFLMGFGFIFADGCFIGSLWKAGQGNVINMFGIFGMLMGIAVSQMSINTIMPKNRVSIMPNYLSAMIDPFMFLLVLWCLGVLLFIIFKPARYRY
jgi:uncharacterized membrane protein YedE/YeeE